MSTGIWGIPVVLSATGKLEAIEVTDGEKTAVYMPIRSETCTIYWAWPSPRAYWVFAETTRHRKSKALPKRRYFPHPNDWMGQLGITC